MRDYTKIPGYTHMTGPQARYNYLHDLMEAYQGVDAESINRFEGCKRRKKVGGCEYCSFSGFLGGGYEVCCNWRAEDQPDKAIEILETLLGREQKDNETDAELPKRINAVAEFYGLANQVDVAQEELAELTQALSKLRRGHFVDPGAKAKVNEEMADVYIMLGQLQHLLGNSTEVDSWIREKVARQERRIHQEKEALPFG